MATYVMSDIHGEKDRFQRMLKIIGFTKKDTMYIIGDVIDRGSGGVELLLDIMKRDNIHLLLGNHEYMCRRCYAPDATVVDRTLWSQNGNAPTVEALGRLDSKHLDRVLTYLQSLPSHQCVKVGRRNFYLVHGYPGKDVHEEVWKRPAPDEENPLPEYRVIIGHTPVNHLYHERNDQSIDHLSIYHGKGYICVDCGCGHSFRNRALACLRLEDMAEFYT